MAGTHYEVLGVARDASAAEVRKAFVAAARRFHPDRHVGADAAARREAERRMREVNDAWSVLGDADRRRDYDRRLGLSAPPRPSAAGASTTAAPPGGATGPRVAAAPPPKDWRAYAAPGGAATRRPVGEQLLMLSPMLFLIAAGAFGMAGALVGWPPFFAFSMTSLICAAISFFMLPIWQMSRSSQRRRGSPGGRRAGPRRRQSYVASRRAAMAGRKPPAPRR